MSECIECRAGRRQAETAGVEWYCSEHGTQYISIPELMERAERAEARVRELEELADFAKTAYWAWKYAYATSVPSLDVVMTNLGRVLTENELDPDGYEVVSASDDPVVYSYRTASTASTPGVMQDGVDVEAEE